MLTVAVLGPWRYVAAVEAATEALALFRGDVLVDAGAGDWSLEEQTPQQSPALGADPGRSAVARTDAQWARQRLANGPGPEAGAPTVSP